jgi:hypothetical protein
MFMFEPIKNDLMRKSSFYSTAVVAILISINAFGQEDARPPKEKWDLVDMRGTVTEISKETRDITLIGRQGDLVTVTASDAVERFDEIAVDDVIEFQFWTYMKAEFRDPTPEEIAEPVQIIVKAGVAPEGVAPEGAVGAIVKAIVTIEALNRPFMLATIKGPEGNFMTLQMEDTELIKELHIGQVVIFTYAEAIVVSLDKVKTEE